jgi:hypothetical protein
MQVTENFINIEDEFHQKVYLLASEEYLIDLNRFTAGELHDNLCSTDPSKEMLKAREKIIISGDVGNQYYVERYNYVNTIIKNLAGNIINFIEKEIHGQNKAS